MVWGASVPTRCVVELDEVYVARFGNLHFIVQDRLYFRTGH